MKALRAFVARTQNPQISRPVGEATTHLCYRRRPIVPRMLSERLMIVMFYPALAGQAIGNIPTMANLDADVMRRLKALADPSRASILIEAKRTPGISCGELVERLGLSQPTVSHHLKELEESGLAAIDRKGNRLLICAHGANVQELGREIVEIFAPDSRN